MTRLRSFHGDLSLISPENLFQLIKLASLSGHLAINCATNATHFIFSEGKINYAFSREGRKRIGQIFLDCQLITRSQLKVCLNEQKAADKRQKLCSILVKKGYLKKSQITDIFYRQLKSAFFLTLTWTEGRFFFNDNSPLVDGDIILEENIDGLILQSLILLDESKY